MILLNVLCSLARQCAQLWVETREKLGHPLGTYEDANLIYPHVSEKPSREVFHLHEFVPLSVFKEKNRQDYACMMLQTIQNKTTLSNLGPFFPSFRKCKGSHGRLFLK